jgi:hypothetical protein
MPQTYELISHTVQALQLTKDRIDDAEMWTSGLKAMEIDALDDKVVFVGLTVPTLDGAKRASEGDWIIKRNGSFDVVKDHKFRQDYRKIS